MPVNKITKYNNFTFQKPQSQNTSTNSGNAKDIKKYRAPNNSARNGKQDDSKQNSKKNCKNPNTEQPNKDCLNTRYQLNVQNYVSELHKALTTECNHNLVNTLNVTLDFNTFSHVTHYALKAIKDHKVFSVLGYFPKVVQELKKRDWVEKRDPLRSPIDYSHYAKSAPHVVNWIESPPLVSSSTISTNEAVWERLKNEQSWSILKDKPSDLIFVTRKRLVNWSNLNEQTSVSQMSRHMFCSKNGLAQCLEPYKYKLTNLMFPRCYYIRNDTDYDEFVDDFITTALVGTVKIIVQAIENDRRIFSVKGTIPFEMIDFVKQCVFKFLYNRRSGCMERDIWKFDGQKDMWNEFMDHHKKLVNDDDAAFRHEYNYKLEEDIYATCKHLLDQVKTYCPQHYMDGNTNMWIIKPTSNCSGHGIVLSRDLQKIKRMSTVAEGARNNYILQKYIETPLLIYTCKIDLRQWFLVTNMNPIVVWIYKEGYVRFCANSFTMQNMHESVHLSNVRLQMKYRKIRNSNVPEECMWDFKELQNYLSTNGQAYVWDELIFPGMSESIYAVLKATTDTPYYRNRTFQLFGADFVITDNYVPYLIEINSIPGLNPSTSVIANLASMLLEDIIKVVVDHERDPNADTGLFVKVVPEETTSATSAAAADTARPQPKMAARLVDVLGRRLEDLATESYHRRMDNVNEKLDAIRKRMTSRESPNNRYLGYNRDNLLMTSFPAAAAAAAEADTTTRTPVTDPTSTAARKSILDDTTSTLHEKITKLKSVYDMRTFEHARDGTPSDRADDQRGR